MSRRVTVIATLAVFLIIAGCTGNDSPTSTRNPPATTTSVPTTSETSRATVPPPVTNPLDLSPVHAHPCAVLTAAQQNQLGFGSLSEESTEDGVGLCRWKQSPGLEYRLRLHLSSDLLAEAYAASDAPDHDGTPLWTTFEPRTIRDLPAVVRSLTTSDRMCEVVVGSGNGQGIALVGETTDGDPTMCDRLVTAAEWVVDAVRG